MPIRKGFRMLSAVAAGAVLLLAQPARPMEPVPEAGTTVTSDFGEIPNEIIFHLDGRHMVLVPAGTYTIGLDQPERMGAMSGEGPQAEVSVGSFYIDKYEVTNEEYDTVKTELGLPQQRVEGNAGLAEATHPVVGISRVAALEYAARWQKDLPTEAEWEIAARGPKGTIFPWGDEVDASAARVGVGLEGTSPIGTHERDKSGFGAYDMSGNVAEWTKDAYERGYYVKIAGQKNPQIPESEVATVRGGDYFTKTPGRATLRRPQVAIQSREDVGFRTVFRLRPKPTPTPSPTPGPATPSPTPAFEARIDQYKAQLLDAFQHPEKPLPPEFATMSPGSGGFVISNQTPHDIVLGAIDELTGKMYNFPSKVESGATRRVAIPSETALHILTYAADSPLKDRVINIGPVSAESEAMIVLPPETYNDVISEDESVVSAGGDKVYTQYYGGDYQPLWNQFEVYNDSPAPAETTVMTYKRDGSIQKQWKFVLEPGQARRFESLPPQKIGVQALYVGQTAPEDGVPVLNFENNDRQDHRRIRLVEETQRADRVRVLMKQLAPLGAKLEENVVADPFRKKYVPATAKGRR